MERIGFVGIGGMGNRMAAQLILAGHPLDIYDTNVERTRQLVGLGARVHSCPRQVAEASEVIFSMLPDGDAVRQAALGPQGLYAAPHGRCYIDCSSIDRKSFLDVATALQERGWSVLDGAVSGVEEDAANARLTLFVAGDKGQFARCASLFARLASRVLYVGELGSAKLVKSATATLTAIHYLALVELRNWLCQSGLSEDAFAAVISAWSERQGDLSKVTTKLRQMDFKKRPSWMPKDVRHGIAAAREINAPVPLSELAARIFEIAEAHGLVNQEASGIASAVYAQRPSILQDVKR